MAHGKEWNKKKVIEVLKPYFQLGCSVAKACRYAGIAESTFQTWVVEEPSLRLQITGWQNEMAAKARQNWRKQISNGNFDASKQWLERTEKDDFSTKTENETKVTHEIEDSTVQRIEEWKAIVSGRPFHDVVDDAGESEDERGEN